MMRSRVRLFLIPTLLLLSGCTIGPKVKDRTVYVNKNDSQGRPVKVGRVAQNAKVKVELETEKGETVEDTIDIGGWGLVPPKENGPGPK